MAPWDRRILLCFGLGLFAALGACGPIEYVNQVTRRADTAVSEARTADAPTLSPYWWTRATEYLRQARVEAAAADFQAANRFGRLATEAAEKAREEARRAAADPDVRERVLPPPPLPPKAAPPRVRPPDVVEPSAPVAPAAGETP
jgi:hypothetical protein